MLFKVYGKKDCMYCTLAVELLEMLNKDYIYMVLDEDYPMSDFKSVFPEAKSIPQIITISNTEINKIGGYENLKELLTGPKP
jgi:glutaredoxin|tara:strand:+ start:229 stop:474 length:246 start_codon:yes stop_codon:yes gene_type:complete